MHSSQRIVVLLFFIATGLSIAVAVVMSSQRLPLVGDSPETAANSQPPLDEVADEEAGDVAQHRLFPEETITREPLLLPGSPASENDLDSSRETVVEPDRLALESQPIPALPREPERSTDPAPSLPPVVDRASPTAPTPTAENRRLLSDFQPVTPLQPPVAAPGIIIKPASHTQSFDGEGDDKLDIVIPGTEIREVLELLSKAGSLNILASKNVNGDVKASLTGVSVDTALDAVLRSTGFVARREGNFVYVGTPEDFLAMDHAADRIGTRVYRPNYITASELQGLITPMLTPVVGTVSISSAAQVGIASDRDSAGGDAFAGAEVLLVRDYEGVLAQVDQVFDEVDRRPLQVSIEAMILSVKLTDELTIGVDWEVLRQKEHIRLAFGSPLQDLANVDLANNGGLKVAFLDSNLAAFLEALEKVGETHVISSPRLMCLNKQRAEIHIGEERGYVSTTVTETAATQSVEFLEVGTQLRLRPYISNDGMVRLEIHPELSTGTVEVSENFTLPRKNVTQVTTNVMVRDGATLVIGGLLREDINTDVSQIPLLGSLPIFGPAFRTKTDNTTRDEIIVLVTPRIVWEPRFNCEGEYANCEFHQQHAIFADKMSHISRVYYGRRYRRLSKAAWVAGDAKAALRYANMSIHFNPLDRESIQLRSQIIAGSGYGDKTVDYHLRDGLYPWQIPGKAKHLNNWVLDELHGPHTHIGQQPAPPRNPGQTGYRSDVHRPEFSPPAQLLQPGEVIERPEPEEDPGHDGQAPPRPPAEAPMSPPSLEGA